MDTPGPSVLDIRLSMPVRATGMFGAGAPSKHVLVAADDPVAFTAALRGGRLAA